MTARTFTGYRPAPPENYVNNGLSNGGWTPDYEGVIFSDGTVVIRWLTAFKSHSVWADWQSFYEVHGLPEYGTRIEFADGADMPVLLQKNNHQQKQYHADAVENP